MSTGHQMQHICNMHTPTENKNLYNSGIKDKKRKARRILEFWFAWDGSDKFELRDNRERFLLGGLWDQHRCPYRPVVCLTHVHNNYVAKWELLLLAVITGHGIWWDYSSVENRQGHSVILAMYTFVVGPWLPKASVISSDLIHKPATTWGCRLWEKATVSATRVIVSATSQGSWYRKVLNFSFHFFSFT